MQIKIAGIDKTSLLQPGSLNISDEVSNRSTAGFQLVDKTGTYHTSPGQPIEIYDNALNLIFGGMVEDPEEENPLGTDTLFLPIQCVDQQALADRWLAIETYDNQTCGYMVNDFITKYLAQEGVWYNPYALSFDGVDDYVSLASASVTTKFTMECWLKNDEVVKDVMFISGASPTYFRCLNGKLLMSIVLGGVQTTLAGLTSLTQGSWHHVAFSYDGVDMKVYLDGILDNSAPKTTALTSFNILRIGRWIDTDQRSLNGTLDDIRIWNVARTQTEIQADMNRELIGNEPGLVGYWKFNEGSGLVAIDSTANGNNGTISGATYSTDVWDGGNIQDGPIVSRAVFPYVQVSKGLDDLAELAGFSWWITADKKLNFVSRETFRAPWNITDTSPIRAVKVRTNKDKYRNRQYIRAGRDVTDPQQESFAGDGKRQTFVVGFGIAQVPTVTLDTVVQTVGIREIDTGKQWYWSKSEKEITQDQSGVPITDVNTLVVDYRGYFPILVVADSGSAISKRKAVEGGTGIYESIDQDASIDSATAALDIANGKLRKYARLSKELTFETDKAGLQAGQIINVTQSIHNITSDEFLIDNVTISEYTPNGDLRYQVHAVDGEALGGWTNFFKALANQGGNISIRENEVLVKLKSAIDTVGAKDTLVISKGAPESRIGYAMIGFAEVG